ncbi:hypothetical protein Daus18300_012802 [Diaporthe australafricana]|uniref:Secreted protein n=1 Tax=Diaporthe australafricana TaxID=127596 RepID=A0ABR3W1F5_9PEZI
MKYISVLLSFLVGIMLSQAALTSDTLPDPMANYTIEDITWTVNVNSDHDDLVTGTIEDVVNHLAIVDPEGFAVLNKSITDDIDVAPSGSSSVAFDKYNATGYLCEVYPGQANGTRVKYGIDYLRKVKGSPTKGPGPSACGRVSCSYEAAIWWCNNGPEDLTLDTYGRIADGAQDLVDSCSFYIKDSVYGDFNGIQFFEGNWTVIVRKNSC